MNRPLAESLKSGEVGPAIGPAVPMRLAVAPMMDRTDRHCRYFLRLLAPHARLYTEMITTGALVHGRRLALLAHSPEEHPIALQLGGNDPDELVASAKLGAEAGYDEINLNAGCPSDRVQAGCFGAALMREPARVAAGVRAMREAVDIPITVKTRLGVDDLDHYGFLTDFVGQVAEAGCGTFIIHARKAWLKGLSPKQNREVPPLDYGRVRQLKRDFPALEIVLNGGLTDAQTALAELDHVDGVMIGRAACTDPFLLVQLDQSIFDRVSSGSRRSTMAVGDDLASALPFSGGPSNRLTEPDERTSAAARRLRCVALGAFLRYVENEVARGTPLRSMTRHLHGLFAGLPGGGTWRRVLGTLPADPDQAAAGLALLEATATRFRSD